MYPNGANTFAGYFALTHADPLGTICSFGGAPGCSWTPPTPPPPQPTPIPPVPSCPCFEVRPELQELLECFRRRAMKHIADGQDNACYAMAQCAEEGCEKYSGEYTVDTQGVRNWWGPIVIPIFNAGDWLFGAPIGDRDGNSITDGGISVCDPKGGCLYIHFTPLPRRASPWMNIECFSSNNYLLGQPVPGDTKYYPPPPRWIDTMGNGIAY